MTENPIFFVIMAMATICFAWGIRGQIIGGEKGAMLPGAMMGILCVWYTGSELLMENVFLFAAAGALGFFYGGMEPYAEIMCMILQHDGPTYNPSKGYLALAFKGSIWGGLGAAFLGISFGAMSGVVYQWYDFVILFALVPLLQEVGYRLFNTPYSMEKNRRPKVYFSVDSREEWGRNLVIVIYLLVLMYVRGDAFALLMWIFGALTGAVGWVIGIWLYDMECHPLKNGKRMFGRLDELEVIDGWKMMEYVQGIFIGLGVSVAFILGWPMAKERFASAEAAGELWYMIPKNVDTVLSWVFCAIIVLTLLLFIIPYRKNGNKITKAFGEVDMNLVEVLERPCYMVMPFALVMLGSNLMANIICCFVMYYVVAQYVALDRFWDYKNVGLIRLALALVGLAILIGQILWGYTLWHAWILYCVIYPHFQAPCSFRPKIVAENWRKCKGKGLAAFWWSFGMSATDYPSYILFMIGLMVFGATQFL